MDLCLLARGHQSPDLRHRDLFTAPAALLDLRDDLSGRTRSGEKVERREVEIAFYQIGKIAPLRQIMDVEEAIDARLTPSERVLRPRQKLGVIPPAELALGFTQMPPDLNHVAHDVLGERTDRIGLLG